MLAAPATAAAPRYILVSGPGLANPALLDDWNENLRLEAAIAGSAQLPRARYVARPRYDLALFWNWTEGVVPTRPEAADQHGSFYPAHGRSVAVVVLYVGGKRVPRQASPDVLRILKRHGVPTRR